MKPLKNRKTKSGARMGRKPCGRDEILYTRIKKADKRFLNAQAKRHDVPLTILVTNIVAAYRKRVRQGKAMHA